MDLRTSPAGGKATRIVATLMAVALVLPLSSCQQFFTASLAGYLARDSYSIPANLPVSDAMALLDTAKSSGDAQMAAALVTPLYNAASAATPGTTAYDEAATALVSAVVMSSCASPALFSIVSDLGIENLGAISGAQIDTALSALMTITLTPAESNALVLISDDVSPPTGSEPDELYIGAFALVVDAFNDAGATESDLNTWLGGGALPGTVDTALVGNATDLLHLAQDADAATGSTSIFGQLLSALSFS